MINPMEMTGRTVLVTGASSGLGRDICLLLGALGARVMLSGRRADGLRETLGQMPGEGHVLAPFDLADVDGIPSWMKELAGRIGPLQGVVHSAGVGSLRPLRTVSKGHVSEVLGPNVAAAFGLARGFRQAGVRDTRGGRLVMMSSAAGLTGNPGQAVYSASKGALIAMARSMALELARDAITVNCVAPGVVLSGMGGRASELLPPEQHAAVVAQHPLGLGTGRDVAHAVVFLLADTGRWITGTTLVVDGGYTA